MTSVKDRIYLALLGSCNESCLFCVRGGRAEPIKHLNTREAKKEIIAAIKDGWENIIFDGGEPTLRKDIISLLRYAKNNKAPNISILTNGLKFAEENFVKKIAKIFNSPPICFSVCVSLHSHRKEVSEFLVGKKETFEITLKGISNTLKHKIPVSIYHIITAQNYKELPNFVDFLHERFPEIKILTFSFIYPAGAALKNAHIFPKISDMESYLYKAMEMARKYGIKFSISTCGTIPLCYLRKYEIYTINQQKLDQPERVGVFDSTDQKRSPLATENFHQQTKIKNSRCSLCLLNSMCGGLWKFYAKKFGKNELRPIIDDSLYKKILIDIKNIEFLKKKLLNYQDIFFVDFDFSSKLDISEAEEAINFIKWMKEKKLNYIIKKPFPLDVKLFKNFSEINYLGIPTNCANCLDLFKVKDRSVYFCNGSKGKNIEQYISRMDAYDDFIKSKEEKKSPFLKKCYFRKSFRSCSSASSYYAPSPYIYIGFQCNNNCVFCSEADLYLEKLCLKSFGRIKKEIREIRRNYDFINLMGREPTLRKDFIKILSFTKQQNFRHIGFTTNGRMLAYESFSREILKTGVNQVAISLVGHEKKIHDRQTQVTGSFDQTILGIKNIIKFKNPQTSVLINLPLNKLNYFTLAPTIDLLAKLGVMEINILFVSPLSKRSLNREIVMSMSDLGKYVFQTIQPYLYRSDLKILLVEFLPCSLPKKARQYFFPCLEKNSEKIRIPLCSGCPYQEKCDGVLRSYIDLYGAEEFSLQ